jgi:hypothetical protein
VMVDLVKVPMWIRRNEALRPLARCRVCHVDDGCVEVDDSNNVFSADLLQVVGYCQTSLPLSSRSATMVS